MTQDLLHKAEEHGQARKLEPSEVLAFTLVSGLKSVGWAMAGNTVILGGRLIMLGEEVSLGSIILTTAGVWAISFAVHLSQDLDTLIDGLRSWRSIETFTPPQFEPERAAMPSSPIIVRSGNKVEVLGRDPVPQLPDGRQAGLGMNPESLSAILQEVITQHGGQWSRRRLMSLRIAGERVTRSLYEEMTDALTRAGFLLPQVNGGYALPDDVQEFDDLQAYLPSLPGLGRAGGMAGRREGPPGNEPIPPERVVGTLAERHRVTRFQELDHAVKLHLMEVYYGS